ncbi:hypothetical protein YC2023_052856 [Brassica napus]
MVKMITDQIFVTTRTELFTSVRVWVMMPTPNVMLTVTPSPHVCNSSPLFQSGEE